MNIAAARPAPPLQDLLGASFEFNTSISALAWDRDFACFGLEAGAIAILRAHWEGAPALRPRTGGGVEIAGGTAPPPPPVIVAAHKGAVSALASDPLGGLLSGGVDGHCRRLSDGVPASLAERPREIAAVAAGRGGRRALAAGRQVDRLGPDGRRHSLPARVCALRYDPSGLHLAIGFEGGVSLEACSLRVAPVFEAPGAFSVLAWRPDGLVIAAASAESGVVLRAREAPDWQRLDPLPGPVLALGYTADGALLIAGADFLYQARADGPPQELRCAWRGRRPAAPLALHPRLGLLACADTDGGILLARPGLPDTLLVRDGGEAVTHLAFSPDGQALAFATAGREAGTVAIPDLLFRTGAVR